MKKEKPSEPLKVRKLIQINNYTWIEKKVDEPDEIIRQKFLSKLPKIDDSKDFIAGIQEGKSEQQYLSARLTVQYSC